MPCFAWALVVAMHFSTSGVKAQVEGCEEGWRRFGGLRGVDGVVYAITRWDADGAGPAPEKFVVAGSFSVAGDCVARNVALYDPSTRRFSPLGEGLGTRNHEVQALAALPGGQLFAAGRFTVPGSDLVTVAQWNGEAWIPVPGAPYSPFNTLTVDAAGSLILGGLFGEAGGLPAPGVARWSGGVWTPVGDTGIVSAVYALAVLEDGSLVASGNFPGKVARLEGTSWSLLGGGVPIQSSFFTLAPLPGGRMFAGGDAAYFWDGSAWAQATGVSGRIQASALLANGDLVVGGWVSLIAQDSARGVARWNGTSWSPMGQLGNNFNPLNVYALCAGTDGPVFIGGDFGVADGDIVSGIARWDGGAWLSTCDEPILLPAKVCETPTGDVIGLQTLYRSGMERRTFVARREGQGWVHLGGEFTDVQIESLLPLSDGSIVVAGSFTTVEGAAARGLARWDGQHWQELGGGTSGQITRMIELPSGELVVSGGFTEIGGQMITNIARWDGSTWSQVGSLPAPLVNAIAVAPSGELFIGASVVDASGTWRGAFRLVGSQWEQLGPRFDYPIRALVPLADGRLVAGGGFRMVGSASVRWTGIWDGAAWQPMGNNLPTTVTSLALRPDGSMVAGLEELYGRGSLWTWRGSTWERWSEDVEGSVRTLATTRTGDLLVCGGFVVAAGGATAYFARYTLGSIADFNHDGDFATDADIEAFFDCLAGSCCPTCGSVDFDGDGQPATDADIESFFRVLAGGAC